MLRVINVCMYVCMYVCPWNCCTTEQQCRQIVCSRWWNNCICNYIQVSFFSIVQQINTLLFTARCTAVQSAVLLSYVACPSVCLSLCPSVTLVDHDHVGWKYWKLIAQTISPTSSFFVAQRSSTYFQGTWRNFGETRGRACLRHCYR